MTGAQQTQLHDIDGLIDDLVLGRVVEFSDLPGVEVPAAVVRRACMQDPPPGASCITLNGATIIGDLDLSHLAISRSLSLRACTLKGELGLSDVRAATMSLCECTVDGTVTADHASIGRLDLSGSTITGSVSMRGATIEHELAMVGVTVGADHNGNSVVADDLRVGGSALLSGGIDATIPLAASAATSSFAGAVRLTRASVDGNVEFVGAHLGGETGTTNALGCSLVVDGAHLGSLNLARTRSAGCVRLVGASVDGQLSFSAANIIGTDREGRSIVADRLDVGGSLFLRNGFRAAGEVQCS